MRRFALVALVGLALAARAGAATFTIDDVSTLADAAPGDGACATGTGTCTLVAAITETEMLPGADEVRLGGLDPVLPPGETTVRGDLRIVGPGAIEGFPDRLSPLPKLFVRSVGSLVLADLVTSGTVCFGAEAQLTVTRCRLSLSRIPVSSDTLVSIHAGASVRMEDTEIEILPGSWDPFLNRHGIALMGGRLDLDGVRGRLRGGSRCDLLLGISGGDLVARNLHVVADASGAVGVSGGRARFERSTFEWSLQYDSLDGALAGVSGGIATFASCAFLGGERKAGRGLRVDGTGTATVSHCRIAGMNGAAVWSFGTLAVMDSVIEHTRSTFYESNVRGGGTGLRVWGGTAHLERTTLRDNQAQVVENLRTYPSRGGGVEVVSGSLVMEDCRIEANSAATECTSSGWSDDPDDCAGGGVVVLGGTTRLDRCAIVGNSVRGNGGGVAVLGGRIDLRNCTISDCTATEVQWGVGTSPPRFYGGQGGGVYVHVGVLHMSSTTIARCSASDLNSGGHGGDGIAAIESSEFIASDSVLADNGIDCLGWIESYGYVLVEDASQCVITSAPNSVVQGLDPALEPLADRGGQTLTHGLRIDSVARDAGNPSGPSDGYSGVLAVDQRNWPRIVDGDGDGSARTDVGAFETCEDTLDSDGDGRGDRCDGSPLVPDDGSDADHDGVPDVEDDGDADGDGVADRDDDCPRDANADQLDSDADGMGDACDGCPATPDDGTDTDGDGLGDACDACPLVFAFVDEDGDGIPDACDDCPADVGNSCSADLLRCALATSRSFAEVRAYLTADGEPVLESARDLYLAGVRAQSEVVVTNDALPVGEGNAGVLVFYEVAGLTRPIHVRKDGGDVIVSGW